MKARRAVGPSAVEKRCAAKETQGVKAAEKSAVRVALFDVVKGVSMNGSTVPTNDASGFDDAGCIVATVVDSIEVVGFPNQPD